MKLKSLEVIGFKSFVDRLQLGFPGGVTAVVGPNGCGKSNVVDAVLWAIGERSAKHLRGRIMEDVIFNGTDGRKPLGMAEVSLSFSNDDGAPPKGYEQYTEITVTRRFFRSGEGEYLINKIPCRLRDITDLFLDTGIGVNGYSIVEQGRVEHLINANPQDRRFLIEEAAGIAKYKERKRLALMKMEATQQNLLRIQDIIAEVKRQTVFLERQVKRAEEYKAIRKEMKEIEIRFALQEYAELSEKGDAARGYLKALRDREIGVGSQVAQKEAAIEGLKLNGMQEEEKLRLLQQDVFELSRRIQKMENEIELDRREREALEKQEGLSMAEVREGLGAWRAAHREGRRNQEAQKVLERERQENGEILEALESLFSDVKETYQSLFDEWEEEKGKQVDILTRLTSLRNRLTHLEERQVDLLKRVRSNQEESEKVSQEGIRAQEAFSAATAEKERLVSLLSRLQEEKGRGEGELQVLKERFGRKQAERVEGEETLRQDRSRYLSLKELQENFEGYEKGVRSLLLRKKENGGTWDGILGTVADILEPERNYELPLEAVLGHRLQYLIVDSEKVGFEALALLKQESLGRGSFVPRAIAGNGSETSSTGSASDSKKPLPLMRFVSVKEGFDPMARFLLGDVGVVERWEEALHWINQEGGFGMLVTLEGDVLERTGVMSGGSRDQGLSILERRREIRELERKVAAGEEICRRLSGEEKRLQQEIFEKEDQLERWKREIQETELERVHRERDLEQLTKDLAQFRQRTDLLQFEKKQLEDEEGELGREKKEVSDRVEEEEARRREGEDQLQSLKKTVEELRGETDRVGGEITEKKVSLASLEEKQKAMETQSANLVASQKTLKEQILRKLHGIREGREKRGLLREKTGQQERELEACLAGHREQEGALSVQKETVEALSGQWKEVEASVRYLRQELEDIRQKIHVEEMHVSEVQLKVQHLQDSIRERYGATLSSSVALGPSELPREEMSKRLAELKTALEGFGEVNLMALEEYQELRRRHDFLVEQQNDLQQALDALKKAIQRINRTTTKRFQETFHLVNEKFKEVFARLFRGGQASLVMVDEQDPATTGIDIIAQPPGKKLQNIDLLSGGEKALVAIALLFGLFMIKRTPFCLLDEVDAPLDDANINRFLDLIRDFSKTSQFVVITHNKKTMEMANTLYGITMETPGVSKVVSVRLN